MLASLRNKFTADWRQIDWRRTILLVLLILAIAAALWQYLMPEIREINTTTFRRVTEIKKVRDVQRIYLRCPEQGIAVLDKAEVTKRLHFDLPAATPATPPGPSLASLQSLRTQPDEGLLQTGDYVPGLDNHLLLDPPLDTPGDGVEILATGDIPESPNGHEVIATIDMSTGVSTIHTREKEAPWFRFTNKGAAGLRYGLNQHLEYTGTAYGRWDFLRVKDVYFSGNIDLSTGGDAKLQAGAEYRWGP